MEKNKKRKGSVPKNLILGLKNGLPKTRLPGLALDMHKRLSRSVITSQHTEVESKPSPKQEIEPYQNDTSPPSDILSTSQFPSDDQTALSNSNVDIYDIPPNRSSQNSLSEIHKSHSDELYDIPPKNHDELYDVPPTKPQDLQQTNYNYDVYDTPPLKRASNDDIYDTPPPSNASEYQQKYRSADELYDVPPPKVKVHSDYSSNDDVYDVPGRKIPQRCNDDIYDIPPSSYSSSEQHLSIDGVGHELYDTPPITRSANQSPMSHKSNTFMPPFGNEPPIDYFNTRGSDENRLSDYININELPSQEGTEDEPEELYDRVPGYIQRNPNQVKDSYWDSFDSPSTSYINVNYESAKKETKPYVNLNYNEPSLVAKSK